MNRILFDGTAMQSTSSAKFHGGGEYAKYIFRKIVEYGYEFDIVLDKNRSLTSDIEQLIENNHKGNRFEIIGNKEIYDLAKKENYDIFYTAHPYEYGDYSGSSQFWGVIHGLRGIELPWDKYKYQYYSSPFKRFIARIAGYNQTFINYWRNKQISKMERLLHIPNAHFVTVSFHSKYSILNYFPFLNDEDINVIYSPVSPIERKANINKNDKKYFLMISGNRYEKNVWRAVLAFDKMFSNGQLKDISVKITGCGQLPFWNQIKNKERFELLDYVSYEELSVLYNGAFAFVYPSLNEGFGYPPLQAMSVDVPVIASSSTSIPEVCKDAAIYFNPTFIDDLCSRILWLTYNTEIQNEMILRGRKRVDSLVKEQEKSIHQFIRTMFNI